MTTNQPGRNDDIAVLMAQLAQLEQRQQRVKAEQSKANLSRQQQAQREQQERQYNALVAQARQEMSGFITRSSPLAGGLLNNNDDKIKRVRTLLSQAATYVPATSSPVPAPSTSVGLLSSTSVGLPTPQNAGRTSADVQLAQGLERTMQRIDTVGRQRQATVPKTPVVRYNRETANLQKFLNAEGATDKNGKPLVVDGIEGPKTKFAFGAYADYKKNTQLAASLDNPLTIQGAGQPPKPLTTTLTTDLSGRIKANPVAAPTTTTTAQTTTPKTTPDLNNLATGLLNVGQLATGLWLGSKGVDMPTIPNRWMDYQKEVTERRNQGFTPVEMASAQGAIANNYRQGVTGMGLLIGGGASPGAALAGLTNLGMQRNAATQNLAVADAGLARQNFGQYGAVTGQTTAMEQAIQGEKINRQANTQNIGVGLIGGAMQNMQQNRMANANADLWARVGQAQIDRENESIAMLKDQREYWKRQLNKPAA
ncbi:MAG: hypothetical protein EAZ91_07470 [Cytophagales bacterium]|nr:MAG: hypothetical protein EAZ91_07470 [Cytophagales bacterium]